MPAQQQRPSETLLYLANAFTLTPHAPPCLCLLGNDLASRQTSPPSSMQSVSHTRDGQDRKENVHPRSGIYHTHGRSGDISGPATSRAPGVSVRNEHRTTISISHDECAHDLPISAQPALLPLPHSIHASELPRENASGKGRAVVSANDRTRAVQDETIHSMLTAKLRALAWYAKPPRRHHKREDD